ncbi:MAG: alanine racemase, partial [Sediminibacterium sp.]|nr:alanine racemase [Sediminibacterium sp.]
FTDRISINNALTGWLTMVAFGYSVEEATTRLGLLQPLDMRMQLVKGILGCTLINDSYSNDETALALAIDYQMKQAGELTPLVILSDIPAPESPDAELYPRLAAMMQEKGVREFIGIGSSISKQAAVFCDAFLSASFFQDTESFLSQLPVKNFQNRIILLKGARVFAFERIVQQLELKTHQTELSINLSALARNVQKHQSLLRPSTKMMVVLKAFGYGTGSAEVAKLLSHHQVQYLAVAYVDEGIELRKAGISLPIMVMNAEESAWDALIQYQLEPEIYSFYFLNRFLLFLSKQGLEDFPVHLKLNTGMNRLGFNADELPALCTVLLNNRQIRIQTVFSHLIASENPAARSVTDRQLQIFTACCNQLANALPYPFIRHIANSAAIQLHPESQLDMVRLGMGMYGGNQHGALALEPVAILTSTIAQIRTVAAGETVGYGLDAVMEKETTIAIVNIGYADGYPRSLGMGNGEMWLGNLRAKIVGHVCMDMALIDVTGIPDVLPGMQVEVFGGNIPIAALATRAGTIPYEIMTGISQRVKRVFWEE